MSRNLQQVSDLSLKEKRALLAELLRDESSGPNTFPLSFAQQRLWFLAQLDPDNPSYNVPQALRLKGVLEINALEQAINAIIARHESLRTTFKATDEQPVQIVSPVHEIKLAFTDLKELPEAEREAEARRLATAEARRPFDLNRDYPLRAALVRIEDDDHLLLLTMHHIVSDGWSMGVLTRELSTIYDAIAANQPIELAELPVQYADFAEWQREWLQGEVLEEQLAYWRKSLAGAPAMLNLQTDYPRPAVQSFQGANLSYILSEKLSRSLNEFSQREGATLFMTLVAAFQTLLFRYTREEDIVVGTPIAGRNRVEIENLIGFFVNTLALRTKLSGNPTFRQLLGRVKDVALGAYAHQDLPFEKLVEELNPERDVGHTPVFQVMFGVQNAPREKLALSRLTITRVPTTSETAKFDLTLFVGEAANGLSCWLEYNTDLFEQKTIERMLGHFEVLLEGIAANPDCRLSELRLLTDAERSQLLTEWNGTQADFPKERCIHQVFEQQVERMPNSVAIVFEAQQLSYVELDRRANQLAHYLRNLGVGPDVIVGLCVERSREMLVGVLGILKAGGAYLPLDPASPRERLSFMLEDGGARVLLTQERLQENLPANRCETVLLDRDWAAIACESEDSPDSAGTAGNLAYVTYTSGSTGKPKGVGITHRSVVRLVKETNYAQFGPDEVLLQFAPLSFDASTFEIWGSLLNGGRLVVMPPGLASLAELGEAVKRHGVTTLWLTAGLFHQMVETELESLRGVRQLLAGGDVLSVPHVELVARELNGCQLINGYGPTENTTFTCCYRVKAGERFVGSVPIGFPISNTQVYILDEELEPVPVGVAGELYAGGDGLASGYLNDSALTAERFVPHPLSEEPGARLYRTGDRARYLADGRIEFLGRMDQQVKLRGYRIEPGEIEATLREHAAVQDAVVIVRDSAEGNKTLVGYVVVDSNDAALQDDKLAAELKSFLKKKLPDYMVPGYFVELDQLPLTPNGKIDRKALPEPGPRPPDSSIMSRPRNEIEFALTLIWERVLNLRPIGLADNFFELGGHSLLAVRLMAEIKEEFGQKIPLVSLFQSATIEGLAGILQQGVSSISWPVVVELQRGGARPPLFCVSHPGVNALGYRSLAQYLEPNQPVYGLQAQYPEDLQGEHSQTAVDALATEYLAAIRAVQPHGPYQLAGMCRGAHIAFEMARRLEQEGETVALVGILDTWVLENTYNRLLFVEYYLRRLTSLLRRGRVDQSPSSKEKADANGNARDPTTATAERTGAIHKNPMYEVYFPGADFVPKTYPGRVTVFRARRQPLNRIRDAQLGWGTLAEGGVGVHIIPGKHGNVLREPNVQGLAGELKKCLLLNRTEENPA
jgi:aspartate racemase